MLECYVGMIVYTTFYCKPTLCSEIMWRCTCNDSRYEVLMMRIHVWATCITVTRANQVPRRTWSCVFDFVGIIRRFGTCLWQLCPFSVHIFKSCFMHDCILQDYWLCFALHIVHYARIGTTFLYIDLISVWYEHRVNLIVKTLMAHIRINRENWGYGLIFCTNTHFYLYISPPIICTPFVPVEKRKTVRKIMKKYCYILE